MGTWEEDVEKCKAAGVRVIAPNGLPVRCIRFDGLMTEIEHGDHPDYMFPVRVVYEAPEPPDLPEWDHSFAPRDHALIYTDGWVCLTVYECTYYLWFVSDGSCLIKRRHGWVLSQDSRSLVRRVDEWRALPVERRAEWLGRKSE